MQFKEIIGQGAVKARLVAGVDQQRIPHAQLFWGLEGCGKAALALAYAQYLNCSNRHDGDSCGTCPSCRQMEKLVHPDVHFLFPYNKEAGGSCIDLLPRWREYLSKSPYIQLSEWTSFSGAAGKQCIIYSQESDLLLGKLSLKSYQSPYKIVFIWAPERMHETLSNKLLKLLEEPPAGTVFLLVSDEPDSLLATIQSRIQSVHVPPVEDAALATKFDPDTVRMAQGSYTRALQQQSDDTAARGFFESSRQLMNAVVLKDLVRLKDWTETTAKIGREPIKRFLDYVSHIIREAFLANLGQPDLLYHTQYEALFIEKLKSHIHPGNVEDICRQLETARAQIGQNALAKSVLFDMGLQLFTKIK